MPEVLRRSAHPVGVSLVSSEEVAAVLRRNPYSHYEVALEALADGAMARMRTVPPVVALWLGSPPGSGKTALDIAVRLKAETSVDGFFLEVIENR